MIYDIKIPVVGKGRVGEGISGVPNGCPSLLGCIILECTNVGLKCLARQHSANLPVTFIDKNVYDDNGLVSVPLIKEAETLISEAQEG